MAVEAGSRGELARACGVPSHLLRDRRIAVIASVRDELRDHEECDHRDRAPDHPRPHGSRIAPEVVRAIGGFDHPTVANYGRLSRVARRTLGTVEIRFCDDRGAEGFSWIVDEPATRTSHALASEGRVWLVDPVRYEPALEWAGTSASLSASPTPRPPQPRLRGDRLELDVPHLVAPDAVLASPFAVVPVRRTKRWREVALWWQAERTLVVAEAIGTNGFYAPSGARRGRAPSAPALFPTRRARRLHPRAAARRPRRRSPRQCRCERPSRRARPRADGPSAHRAPGPRPRARRRPPSPPPLR